MNINCQLGREMPVSRCGSTPCSMCGWNEDVNRSRRKEIRRLAEEGRLKSWGKTVVEPTTEEKILELKRELGKLLRKLKSEIKENQKPKGEYTNESL